jgi:hypothetical protein
MTLGPLQPPLVFRAGAVRRISAALLTCVKLPLPATSSETEERERLWYSR